MFESKSAYFFGTPLRKETNLEEGIVCAYHYKVKTKSGKPYYIRVEEYPNTVFFLKFYPKSLEHSPKKFRNRFMYEKDRESLSRLVATCIQLAKSIRRQIPQAIFAFYGQWDEVDVQRASSVSQRFRIYRRVVSSLFSGETFKHLVVDSLNVYVLIPTEVYSESLRVMLMTQFDEIFGDSLVKLQVPQR